MPPRTLIWTQRVLGVVFLVAGVAKFFPQIEDVGGVLSNAAAANHGTLLAPASDLFATHHVFMTVLVAVAMIATGAVQLLDRGFIRAASTGQILMCVCFSTFIFRSIPQVVLVDLLFVAACAYVVVSRSKVA